jgi:hypothetical protein
MKRLVKISALLLLYCLTTAKSCSNNEEGKAARERYVVDATVDTIRRALSSDSLSEESLRAFGELAGRKLLDFSDYMKILTDSSIDTAFRQKAAGMIKALFISDSVVISLGNDNKKGALSVTVKNLVNKRESAMYPGFDSVKIIQPLYRTAPDSYTGRLSSLTSSTSSLNRDGRKVSGQLITVDFSLVRIKTIIDKDTLNSWKVLLGNIH